VLRRASFPSRIGEMGKIRGVGLIILGVWAVLNLGRTTFDIYKKSQRLDELRDRVEELEEERAGLEERLEFVQSPEFIEQEARDKLSMLKLGEHVVLVPSEEGHGEGEAILGVRVEGDAWKQWVELFFD